MEISDILTLAKAGFNREDIARIAQALAPSVAADGNNKANGLSLLSPTAASQPDAAPAPVVPVPPAPAQTVPAAVQPIGAAGTVPGAANGDIMALFGAVNKLQTSIDQLATPQAGAVGAPMEPVTSIEDIIKGPIVHNDTPITGYPFTQQNK